MYEAVLRALFFLCLPSPPQFSMLYIPPEIVDFIIDELWDDKPALKTCSCVYRDWLPRSRRYLFASVTLRVDWYAGVSKMDTFLSLISSPLATFLPYIDEVRLTHKWNARDDGSPMLSPGDTLAALQIRGVRPSRLYLDCRSYLSHPPAGTPALTSSVLHLAIQMEGNYVALDSIANYVCSFPLLQSLKIVGRPSDVNGFSHPAVLTLPSQLHTFYTSHKSFTDWLLTLNPPPTQITKLGILQAPSDGLDWPAVNRYLTSPCAAGIETLVFDTTSFIGSIHGPELQNLRRLRHLVINQLHVSAPNTLRNLLSVLETAPTVRGTLETITLSRAFRNCPVATCTFPAQEWRELDAAVADSVEAHEYPRLRRFVVNTADEDSCDLRDVLGQLAFEVGEPIALALQTHLGRCAHHGLLRVEGIPNVPSVSPKVVWTTAKYDTSPAGLDLHSRRRNGRRLANIR
ncbi:hypothetical protein FB45DRAFT_339960 [Roridomyces roridus]|uniref:Uncharacterized protein n=1 Tax=Roridomyces roridus TaxID=1738132 RepID=A0AAD7B4S9_9AGAR|nr:hypothetical protein FB45DRAFT_339960 [Roridomyces roridus]